MKNDRTQKPKRGAAPGQVECPEQTMVRPTLCIETKREGRRLDESRPRSHVKAV